MSTVMIAIITYIVITFIILVFAKNFCQISKGVKLTLLAWPLIIIAAFVHLIFIETCIQIYELYLWYKKDD